jgi:hypothetical protein
MPARQLRVPTRARPSASRLPAQPAAKRAWELLSQLFPESADRPGRVTGRARWGFLAAQLGALIAGAAVMLARFAGQPPWHLLYAEDLGIYLPWALAHPWYLLESYAGFLQLVPRLIAQFAVLLPIRDAAVGFSVGGALVASACALFVYHASAGHIGSRWLRVLLGLSVVLLPVAQLEIADNAVNSPWYLLVALFWAVLWRPATRGAAVAALAVGFFVAASSSLALLFAPLIAARVITLPWRVRDQAVTAGWVMGSLLQVLVILTSHLSRTGTAGPAKGPLYYSQDVILPSLGWHLSWVLRDAVGVTTASLLVGGFLVLVLGLAAMTQGTRCAVFVITAVLTSLAFAVISAVFAWGAPDQPVTRVVEPGARYSTVPILLLIAALIVATDAYLRRGRPRRLAVAAVTALLAVLAVGWVSDFRYPVNHTRGQPWTVTANVWQRECQRNPAGSITVGFHDFWGTNPLTTTFSCPRLRD